MDHDRIETLVRAIKDDTPGAGDARADLCRLLRGWFRYKYRYWAEPYLPSHEFDRIAENAISDAITTYEAGRAKFATWATCQLRFIITDEIRQRRRTRIQGDQEQLDAVVDCSKAGQNPLHRIEQDELIGLMMTALQAERDPSKSLVLAWVQGYPPVEEIIRTLKVTPDYARKSRGRNIEALRKSFKNQGHEYD
jgi:DNA-directed RNA polymerase specialized sigma24 family protein